MKQEALMWVPVLPQHEREGAWKGVEGEEGGRTRAQDAPREGAEVKERWKNGGEDTRTQSHKKTKLEGFS